MNLSHRWPLLVALAAWPLGWSAVAYAEDPFAVPPTDEPPPAVAEPFAATPTEADRGAIRLTGAGRSTVQRTSNYAVDPNGARSNSGVLGSSRLTLQGDVDTGKTFGDWSIQAAVAADALSGTFTGRPTLEGDKLPGGRWDQLMLTQAWAGVSLRDLAVVKFGVMNSHWGLGLLANDGNHAMDSRRDDYFVLPTTGDRVARAQLILQPWGRSESLARGLFLAFSVDNVIEDNTAIRAQGDDAWQQVAALRWHFAKERWAGIYYVHRDQTYHDKTGPFLKVNVIDAAFDVDYRKAGTGLRLQAEAALILGRTNLAPTPEHPEHDVRQSAAVAKARYDLGKYGLRFELDGGYFSGDDNLDDAALTGFKANPNFQQGLLLFSQVLGFQSGRARITAQNPSVTGYPSADLDRLATNGSVTSAITAFPKVGWTVCQGFEVYGGALLAFSPTAPVDPFTTRAVGGGVPYNYVGKKVDGSLLGTEFDLGAVVKLTPKTWPMALSVRGEYALLLPGGVLNGMDSDSPIHGGRLSLALTPVSSKEKK